MPFFWDAAVPSTRAVSAYLFILFLVVRWIARIRLKSFAILVLKTWPRGYRHSIEGDVFCVCKLNKSENLNLGIPPLDDLSEDDVFTWVWETAAGSEVTLRLPCAPKHHHHTSARFPLSHTTTCVPPYTLVPGHPVNCCPSVTKPFWWRWWGPWPKSQSVKSVYQFSIDIAPQVGLN